MILSKREAGRLMKYKKVASRPSEAPASICWLSCRGARDGFSRQAGSADAKRCPARPALKCVPVPSSSAAEADLGFCLNE